MASSDVATSTYAEAAPTSEAKPKRVRTGCLTCRERHLKCDEGTPSCLNCRKSSRECKRGVRLNFIDTQCAKPPIVPATEEWKVIFMDESREIASEYKGGRQRYSIVAESEPTTALDNNNMSFEMNSLPSAPTMTHRPLPSIQGMLPNAQSEQMQSVNVFDQPKDHTPAQSLGGNENTSYPSATMSTSQQSHYDNVQQNEISHHNEEANETREILNTQEETLFMQVFVEEVGIWMDSMDSMKHFSRLLPFHALGQPMLLNAFLACGVRHLTLVNPAKFQEEKALNYYDKASRYLLRALENPERDSVICATTAVILNVYEIMTEKALPRMSHIAGARALIKECGWNARSSGIGAACFWLNVGMELLSNLHFNWRAAWHPDAWGLELDFSQETEAGREEVWTHRIVYICAKIGDFRATIPRSHESSPQNHQMRQQKRTEEWMHLKNMADTWNNNIPRTMHPMAFLYPYQTTSNSAFPEVWLLKRTTIVARLFYHTAMCLLAQTYPLGGRENPDMREMEQQHAHQICGIAAHVKDRGVASVALRSLHIAAECLTIRREQEEVLRIFSKIHKETGWRIGFIPQDLTEKWGWDKADPSPKLPTHQNPQRHMANGSNSSGSPTMASEFSPQQFDQYGEMMQQRRQAQQAAQQQQAQSSSPVGTSPQQAQPRKQPPQGIVNPMFAQADFSNAKHPYQDHYVVPSHQYGQQSQHQQGLGLGLGGTGGGGTTGLGMYS